MSVIIPAYNAASRIHECLESVDAQTGNFELEVIVVDDGSDDDTVARVVDHGVAACIRQHNGGPAAARNAALRASRGDYIAFLDSDDRWPEGKLARQLELLETREDIGLLFGDCRQFDATGAHERTLFECAGYDARYWGDPVYVLNPYAKLVAGNFITTGSVVMRAACVAAAGYFNEELRLVEDLEYWFRVSLICRFAHLDRVCLLRRRHAANSSRDQIAMSLAYLGMLEQHRRKYGELARRLGADLDARMIREYRSLGHLYSGRGAHADAARAYLRAIRGRFSIRSAYYLLSALRVAVRGSRRHGT